MKMWLKKHITEYRVIAVTVLIFFGILFYSILSIDVSVTQIPTTAYTTRADCTRAAVRDGKEINKLKAEIKRLRMEDR